jgi:hypothetical protein
VSVPFYHDSWIFHETGFLGKECQLWSSFLCYLSTFSSLLSVTLLSITRSNTRDLYFDNGADSKQNAIVVIYGDCDVAWGFITWNLQEIEEQQLRWYGHVMRMDDCRTARQVADWNPQGKGDVADQWTPGRMGLGTACKEGISRMKNILIERFGERKLCL